MLASELDEIALKGSIVFEPRSTLDDGIIAIMHNADGKPSAVYGYYAMIEALKKHDHMTYEQAVEFIEYNIENAIPKCEGKPIIVWEVER